MNALSRCHLFNSLQFLQQQNIDYQIISLLTLYIMSDMRYWRKPKGMQWIVPIHLVPSNSHIRHAYPLTIVYFSSQKRKEEEARAHDNDWLICSAAGYSNTRAWSWYLYEGCVPVAEQHAIHDTSASSLHELHDLLVNKQLRLSLHFCNDKNQPHLRGRIYR